MVFWYFYQMKFLLSIFLVALFLPCFAHANNGISQELEQRIEAYKNKQISLREVFEKDPRIEDLISLTYLNKDQSNSERNIVSNALYKLSFKVEKVSDVSLLNEHLDHFKGLADDREGFRSYSNARILLLKLNVAGDKEPDYIFDYLDGRSYTYYSFAEWMKEDASYLRKLLDYPEKSEMICNKLQRAITHDVKLSIFLVKRSVDVFLKFAENNSSCRRAYIETYLEYKKWVDGHRGVEPDSLVTLFDYYNEVDVDKFMNTYKNFACAAPPQSDVKSWAYIHKADYGYLGPNDEQDVRVLKCTK